MPGDKLRILCIEDETNVADYISSLLDKNKYSVQIVTDGQKALDLLLSNKVDPDVILLDYLLPSLDGIQVLKALNAHKKFYAVIFLTAVETLDIAIAAMKEGALDYLPKSHYLKLELNLKIEKAHSAYKESLKKLYYEEQISLLTQAVEQNPTSIVITDKYGNIKYVNNKFLQYTGYTVNEVIGQNPRILKTDNYPPGFFDNLWKTITSGKTWKGEFKNRKKNGEIYCEKAIITGIKDRHGNISSYLGIKEDITELKKAEQALKQKTEELDNFFTVTLDLLCIIEGASGKFIRVNNAWESTLGYTKKEMLGKPFTDFVHPHDVEHTLRATVELHNKGKLLNFVNRYVCKDRSVKFIEWSCISNNDGTFYASARDITKRRLNEQALKESEDRFRSIFEMANAGIFFANQHGQFIMANKAFLELTEYSAEEILDMDFTQLTFEDDRIVENELLKELVFNEIDQYRIEKRYITRSNKIIWADTAVTVINDEKNNPVSYVGVVNNISARKEYELKLKEMVATKDKFFSIISHDLKNQFSSMMALSDIVKGIVNKYNDEHSDKYADLLYQNSRNALGMLEDLLKWASSQINGLEMKKEDIDMSELIQHLLLTLNNQANLKKIELTVNIDPHMQLHADRQMIGTVVRNLVNNAIKFTPEGGEVIISCSTHHKYNIISVKDNGVGMPPDVVHRIFRIDKKHSTLGTAKEMGTGLGLILCKEFIDKHGGEIKVSSHVGKGSEFIIKLPVK